MFDIIFDPYNYPFWIFIALIIIGSIFVIYRPFAAYIKFAYPNAKFEAIGNPFVEEKELNRLLDSKDLSELKDSINILKDYQIEGNNSQEIQDSLDKSFIKTINESKKDNSKEMYEFYNSFLEKIDVYLIKNILKNKINGLEIDKNISERAILDKTKNFINDIISIENDKLQEFLNQYSKIYFDNLKNFIDGNDFLTLDAQFDKYFINNFRNIIVPKSCEQGKKLFVNTMVDILNIKNILRAKQLNYDQKKFENIFLGDGEEISKWKFEELIQIDQISQIISSLEGTSYYNILKDSIEEYNKENSIQVFENKLESLYLKLVKNISIKNYTNIGPSIRFLVSKEFEIKNLKIITKGLEENLNSDIIKSFLILEAS